MTVRETEEEFVRDVCARYLRGESQNAIAQLYQAPYEMIGIILWESGIDVRTEEEDEATRAVRPWWAGTER